jgi:hypothetical protein
MVAEKQEVKLPPHLALELPEIKVYGSGGLMVSCFLKKETSV